MNAEIQAIIDASKKIIVKKTHLIIFLKENKRSALSVATIIKELKKTVKGLILVLQKNNRKIKTPRNANYPCFGIVVVGEINEIWDKALEEKFIFLPSRVTKLTKEQAFLHAHLCVEKNKDFKILHEGKILNTTKFLYGE